MPRNTSLQILSEQAEYTSPPERETSALDSRLAVAATARARSLRWMPGTKESQTFAQRIGDAGAQLEQQAEEREAAPSGTAVEISEEQRWVHDNRSLIQGTWSELRESAAGLRQLPHVRTAGGTVEPRVLAIAEDFLLAAEYLYSDQAFAAYLEAFQKVTVLELMEMGNLVPALKLVLLERVASGSDLEASIRSLWGVKQAPWKELLESLVMFERVLREDPAGAYARMDFESREMYRRQVVDFAQHSDCSEMEIAQKAIALARESKRHPERDPRLAQRKAHVGYYLVAEGSELLLREANAQLPWGDRLQRGLRRHPDEFYLYGIEALTLLIAVAIVFPMLASVSSFGVIIFAILALVLPCSQSAVEVMNYLTTSLLRPRRLPKLDFAEGVPDDCVTMVVVPTLLLNQKQVQTLVEDLEVRYLGNADRNVHFALLTDLADSVEAPNEDSPLVEQCSSLVRELNQKYGGRRKEDRGQFFLFHRHRIYNRREGVWMGWERKRGKLLDFNQLVLGSYDSFPVKVGELALLPRLRYVLTLDSDTELPRGAAQRMIGALAHPLNQAIIDPEFNIVNIGYSILQPRVGISVQSAASSHLADIYSGQTGFDIYTHAVSDVYQDLYGEAIFTGKGLYEVATLQQVLQGRFPRNSLLSHDLIEGAYGRVGLVSDIEVIDDYPSHYSAYNRRKHRWLRGDWQIVEWLLPRVQDERGRRVPNPITLISRWKIFDNLRRSVVEASFFLLLLLGWTVLPGRPLYWTLVTLAILFVPPLVQFAFALVRSAKAWRWAGVRDGLVALRSSFFGLSLSFTFLAHQTLLSADAIFRTLYRRVVSQQRLLEWETAAEAELGTRKRTPVDVLLNWTPVVVIAVGVFLYFIRRAGFWVALPILLLWACSRLVSLWLNLPPRMEHPEPSGEDRNFVRCVALHTWRYFAEFSTPEHNWLIPDNVQEKPAQVAARLSPTNLGLLLNARQAACELGYITAPEFAALTQHTLDAMLRLEHFHGHLFNWYDTRSLQALPPRFVSSVDNGNLLASLVTLRQGALASLRQPLINRELLEGYRDHVYILAGAGAISRKSRALLRESRDDDQDWLDRLLNADKFLPPQIEVRDEQKREMAEWYLRQARARVEQARQLVNEYAPWLLPEFKELRDRLQSGMSYAFEATSLEQLAALSEALEKRLGSESKSEDAEIRQPSNSLLLRLPGARAAAERLKRELKSIAVQAEQSIEAMDFALLLDRRRKLLSIGYDVEAGKLHASCYDLLASESRTATFLAIAKGDIPQECWFNLGRSQTAHEGRPLLISWTGTMFEYLMPAMWMRSYPNTMLHRTKEVAVAAQQAYAERLRIPWGTSESSYAELNEGGSYGYRAFGVPQLAIQQPETERVVVAPYASVMALGVDPEAVVKNMRSMVKMKPGWLGAFGLVEAADYSVARGRFHGRRFQLVPQWMAHHQGMSLLAFANYLKDDVVQSWFHGDRRVQATELLLHERPLGRATVARQSRQRTKPATRKAPLAVAGLSAEK
ncbi:MAG: glucoamylase family protein [Acidobacteriaceae bacterium]